MLKILGKEYYIDLDKLGEFFTETKTESPNTMTITATYDSDMSLLTKEVAESRGNINVDAYTIRFDAVKLFLDSLLNNTYDNDGRLILGEAETDFSLSQRLAFNSLLIAGILKPVE